jgi:hypothetical protein
MDEFDLIRDHRHLPPEALMESTVPSDESPLGAVMQRRAEMQRALRDLSAALDEPHQAQPELWQKRIRDSLTALAADFEAHLRVTEGPGGLHEQVVRTAPRLAHAVSVLTQEHVQLAEQLILDHDHRPNRFATLRARRAHLSNQPPPPTRGRPGIRGIRV